MENNPESTHLTEQIHQPEIMAQDEEFTVYATRKINVEEAETLFGIMSRGFTELNRKSLLKQDMTFDEFLADGQNTEVVKFKTVNNRTNELIGTGMGHIGLQDIGWVNQNFLKAYAHQRIPHLESDHTYYIGTIAVDRDAQGLRGGYQTVKAFENYFLRDLENTEGKAIAFFDHASDNDFLPMVIQHAFDEITEEKGLRSVEVKQIGQHKWFGQEIQLTQLQADTSEISTASYDAEEAFGNYQKHIIAEQLHNSAAPSVLSKEKFMKLSDDDSVSKIKLDGVNFPLFVQTELDSDFSAQYVYEHFVHRKVIYVPSIDAYKESQDEIEKIINTFAIHAKEDGYDQLVVLTDTISDQPSFLHSNGADAVEHENQKYWVIQQTLEVA